MRLDHALLFGALSFGTPDDHLGPVSLSLDENGAAQRKRLGDDPQRRLERLLDVFEAREQLADFVKVLQALLG
jgi:hypothetical protein